MFRHDSRRQIIFKPTISDKTCDHINFIHKETEDQKEVGKKLTNLYN